MPKLLKNINFDDELAHKLFAVEFLGSTTKDLLVTLIITKNQKETWRSKRFGREIRHKSDGRSRKQKLIISTDTINETLNINNQVGNLHIKSGFTQPNTNVNVKMIEWVLNR